MDGWGKRGRAWAAVSEVPSGRRGFLRGTATPFRFGVNFSYYGLTLDVSGLGLNVYQTQLLFGAVELPSKIMVYFLVRRLGRRLTEAGMLLGAALTFGTSLLVSLGKPGLAVPSALCGDSASHPGGSWLHPLPEESLSLQRLSHGSLLWWWWGKLFLKLLLLRPTCSRPSCTLLCSGKPGTQATALP